MNRSLASLILAISWLVVPALPLSAQRPIEPKAWSIEEIHGPALPFEATVDEGTYLSLDVSPDGRTIIFDLLGDLYQLAIGGGTATRITSGPAWDTQPRYAPDGKRIIFLSDRDGSDQIWTANPDGSGARQFTHDASHQYLSPIWTWDGLSILALRGDDTAGIGTPDLVLFDRDGGAGIKLLEKTAAAGPVASPDGRYVYFVTSRYGWYDGRGSAGVLNRLERRNGQVLPLTGGYGEVARPAVSRDGKLLAYLRVIDGETVMIVRDLEAARERVIYRPMDRLEHPEDLYVRDTDGAAGYSFTPDGRSIVFSAGGKIRRVDVATGAAAVIPFSARIQQTLTEKIYLPARLDDGPFAPKILHWTQPTPDGQTLVFGATGKLYRYSLASRKAEPIAEGPGLQYAPAVSSDGRWLVYVTWSDQETGHVYKLPVAGGTPIRLTSRPGRYTNPSWALDGTKIVVASAQRSLQDYRTVTWDIGWLDPGGEGPLHPIASMLPRSYRRQDPQPRFDARGERVFFAQPAGPVGSGAELVSVRLDGTDRRRILELEYPDAIIPSPDGRHVAYVERQEVYVASLPLLDGREPVRLDTRGGPLPIRKLSKTGGDYIYWLDGGKSIAWSWGPKFYRVRTADASLATTNPDSITAEFELPRSIARGRLLLKNARIVTMDSGSRVIERGDLLVENGRIRSVGPAGTISTPPDTRTLDLAGKTLVPGFVDIHAHLPLTSDQDTDVHPERSWPLLANLAYGVTTWRDPSARSQAIFALAEMVEAGRTLGPRIFSTGDIFLNTEAWCCGQARDLDDARQLVRRQKALGANYIKEHTDPTRRQMQWAVQAAREENIMIATDVSGGPRRILREIVDGYTSIEHYFFTPQIYQDVVQLLARAGTYFSPTLIAIPGMDMYFYQATDVHGDQKLRRFTPHPAIDEPLHQARLRLPEEWTYREAARSIAKIIRGGGKVALGSHGNRQGLGAHWEIWATAEGGLTPMEALRFATITPAEAIGLQRDLGSLEVGKMADLIVLDANPLDDIRNTVKITYVMKAGTLWDGNTMDEVWPNQRPLGPLPWEKEAYWRGDQAAKRANGQ